MSESTEKKASNVRWTLPDPLRHFAKDAPGWRLAALLLCKLSSILLGLAALLHALHVL